MHPTLLVCAALCLTPLASSQTPSLPSKTSRVEVTDLVERFSLDSGSRSFLTRLSERKTFRSGFDGGNERGFHRVPYAGQFLSLKVDGEFDFGDEEPVSIFTENSLIKVVENQLGVDEADLEFVNEGGRRFLVSSVPERVQVVIDGIRSALPHAIRLEARLTRTKGDRTTTLLDETAYLRDGTSDVLGEIRRRRAIVDFEVEIAQASASGNPTTIEVQSGTTLGLRPRLFPLAEEVLVDAFLRRAIPIEPQNLDFQRDIGPIEPIFDALASVNDLDTLFQTVPGAGSDAIRLLLSQRPFDARTANELRARVELIEDGWFATAAVRPAIGNRPRSIRFSLDYTTLRELRQIRTRLNQRSVGATDAQEVVLPVDEVTIELPESSTTGFDQILPLDQNGTAILRRAAPDLLGEGRSFVVRLKVD